VADAPLPSPAGDEEAILSTLLAESPRLWELVAQFVHALPIHAGLMQDALRDSSFDRLRALAAELRVEGRRHGYGPLADLAAELEGAAEAGLVDALAERLNEFTLLIVRIHAGLRKPHS
jgi:hypothetical protein